MSAKQHKTTFTVEDFIKRRIPLNVALQLICQEADAYFTSKQVEVLQQYFKVNWKFAKSDYIYYIDPESGTTMCKSESILYNKTSKYQFELVSVKTIKEYVNRLQKQETNLDRRDGQPTSRIQCTSSKTTIASGHLEYGKIDFRWGGKAKIGKANLSF